MGRDRCRRGGEGNRRKLRRSTPSSIVKANTREVTAHHFFGLLECRWADDITWCGEGRIKVELEGDRGSSWQAKRLVTNLAQRRAILHGAAARRRPVGSSADPKNQVLTVE